MNQPKSCTKVLLRGAKRFHCTLRYCWDRIYLSRTFEAIPQSVADFPEGWHPPPARPERAGSGEAMAFALYLHIILNCLQKIITI